MIKAPQSSIAAVSIIICYSIVGSAHAESATTTWTAYLYQGPGAHYSVVDELPQATPLDLAGCENGWCRVTSGDRVGYLRAEVVARGDPAHPPAGVLPQPAAALSAAPPPGPCVEANQTGGNGGNAMTIFCNK